MLGEDFTVDSIQKLADDGKHDEAYSRLCNDSLHEEIRIIVEGTVLVHPSNFKKPVPCYT